MIKASEMRKRNSRSGIINALVDKYISSISELLDKAFHDPSVYDHICIRIYGPNLERSEYDRVVNGVSEHISYAGYKTTFTEGNLLTIRWD